MSTLASDPIVGRIWRAVPRTIDRSLRDDIIGEAYLAIREGRLHPRDIETAARTYINAGFRAFASHWGAISLDQVMNDDDDRTRLEMIEDETALAAFDRVGFEWEARA